jgi:hypothetical protein
MYSLGEGHAWQSETRDGRALPLAVGSTADSKPIAAAVFAQNGALGLAFGGGRGGGAGGLQRGPARGCNMSSARRLAVSPQRPSVRRLRSSRGVLRVHQAHVRLHVHHKG